jgi:hypothetical protein
LFGGRVGVVTVTVVQGRRVGVRSPTRVRDFSFLSKCHDWLWGQFDLLLFAYWEWSGLCQVLRLWMSGNVPLFFWWHTNSLPFYSATGWIYCANVWLLRQNTANILLCLNAPLLIYYFGPGYFTVSILWAGYSHLGSLFTISVLLAAYCLKPVHDLQYICPCF